MDHLDTVAESQKFTCAVGQRSLAPVIFVNHYRRRPRPVFCVPKIV